MAVMSPGVDRAVGAEVHHDDIAETALLLQLLHRVEPVDERTALDGIDE